MEALLCILYSALFIFLIYRLRFFRDAGLSSHFVAGIFVLKIVTGVALSLIYTKYYTDRSTADIYKYFDDSAVMHEALSEAPEDYFRMVFSVGNDNEHFDQYYRRMNNWYREYESNLYNDSHTIIRFNAVLRIFSFGYYNVHTVFMCFISLIGLMALFRALRRFFNQSPGVLAFAIFLLPSVVFWGSGVLKEGLLLFGLGLLIYHLFKLIHNQVSILSILIVVFCLFLLFHLKFYVIAALTPGLLAYFWVAKTNGRMAWLKYLVVGAVCLLAALNLHHINPQFDALKLLVQKQHDFIRLVEHENSGSAIALTPLSKNFSSFVISAPEALFNSLFRPLPHRISSVFHLLPLLENVILLGLLLMAVFHRRIKQVNLNALLFCASFVLILFLVIGWTTPVVGAIVRYKVPALPFLAAMLLMLADHQWIRESLLYLKRFGRKRSVGD